MVTPSQCTEQYIDHTILSYYNEICKFPEWVDDIKHDVLIIPPKIIWYIDNTRAVDGNVLLSAERIRVDSINYSRKCPMRNYDDTVYRKYIANTLHDVVFRIVFFRVGLINESARRYIPLEKHIEMVVRHEWRHILQDLYLLKMEYRSHGSKESYIKGSFAYSSPEQLFEEDAREVAYNRPDKPIEEFYEEYKKVEYMYLKRKARQNKFDILWND